MIHTLQKRFILSAMLAVGLLLAVLLGAINVGNVALTARQSRQTADMLLNEARRGQPPPKEDPPRGFLAAPTDANARMAALYFTVLVGADDAQMQINTERIADVTAEEAEALCRQAMAKSQSAGRVGRFLYRAAPNERAGGTLYLFLDTAAQRRSVLRVAFFSLTAGLACFVAMLFFVILLSKKAIRPIAENMERQKQFVTDAGHEIKTPLAIILANAEAMALYEGENKWLKNIREQTVRLNGLMQNLLALAKGDEAVSPPDLQPVALSEELNRTLETFAEPMRQKELTVTAAVPPGLTLRADPEQLRRLLLILFDNAVKYSPRGGEVQLTCRAEGKKVELTLQNQCEALPNCPAEKLFDRFYRADAARTHADGGYGVGLSIAKTIVEAHGGTLRAAYLPPNAIAFTAAFPQNAKPRAKGEKQA